MLFCPKFRKLRLKLIRNIIVIDASIYNIPHSSRFTYMMNNQNVEIIKGIVHLNIIFSYMKVSKICNLDHPVY